MIKIRYLVVPWAIFLFSGCCVSNYSSEMKEVLEPIEKKMIVFYKKNNRYPTIQEHYKLLEKVGCKVENNICLFKGNKFYISIPKYENGGNIGLSKDNSSCYISLNVGKKDLFTCNQESCFKFDLRQ